MFGKRIPLFRLFGFIVNINVTLLLLGMLTLKGLFGLLSMKLELEAA